MTAQDDKLSDIPHELAPEMLRALKTPVDRERLRELTERRRLNLHVSRVELCDGVDGLLAEIVVLTADRDRIEQTLKHGGWDPERCDALRFLTDELISLASYRKERNP